MLRGINLELMRGAHIDFNDCSKQTREVECYVVRDSIILTVTSKALAGESCGYLKLRNTKSGFEMDQQKFIAPMFNVRTLAGCTFVLHPIRGSRVELNGKVVHPGELMNM